MTTTPWSQAVSLHPDVASGNTAVSLYAIDLGSLAAGGEQVPYVYRNARNFFAATHLTDGLGELLNDVLSRLSGQPGDRVLQLHSPFGGGKTHSLAALFYAASDFNALKALPGADNFPNPGTVRIALFDGLKFDVLGGTVNRQAVKTMWGHLAAQLGNYDLVAYHDKEQVAPGEDVILAMLGDQPALLLMDEVLVYVERASAAIVAESTLGRQTQTFLQTLSVAVAKCKKAVLLYSLQASITESFGNTELLNTLDHLVSRVDAKREPVTMQDTLPVLRRRLLDGEPDKRVSGLVASEYARIISKARSAMAVNEAERRKAEHERTDLQDTFENAYPFHPQLINLMRERWASLPNFQRTRGALRFLAVCLYTLHTNRQAREFLGAGDIPLENPDVQQAFFSEVGQRTAFQSVLERDFFGPNARIRQIDERMASEDTSLTGVNPAMRLATAILMYSFGGLTRADGESDQPVAIGVTESELLDAVISPDLDSITAQAALGYLRNQCLYLHFDGVHYAFKTTPNVTQVLEDFASRLDVIRDIDPAIKTELNGRLQGRSSAILWPPNSQYIPHREPRFLLGYLPLDFAFLGQGQQEEQAQDYFTHYGEHLREYRNGMGLSVPASKSVAELRQAQKYLLAIGQVNAQHRQLQLTSAQLSELRERERTYKTQQESAIRGLYESVWLPVLEGQSIGIEKVELGGRALSANGIHERLIELLSISPPRLFPNVTPERILDLMQLGMDEEPRLGVSIQAIVDAFYGTLSFPRLDSSAAIRRAIADGVQRGLFGYVGRAGLVDEKLLREDSDYLIDPSLVRINTPLPEVEIDEGSALIVLPQTIQPAQPEEVSVPVHATSDAQGSVSPESQTQAPYETGPVTSAGRQFLRLRMSMTRQQLFAAWNAFKNLADLAGNIRLTVEADKPDGFDENWLRNAFYEPLDEADIDVEES
jgi:hypothetical protein